MSNMAELVRWMEGGPMPPNSFMVTQPHAVSPHDQIRFWNGVSIGTDKECWPWLRSCNTGGYGQFGIRGKNIPAHKVAYWLKNRTLPRGKMIRHTCDNRSCCNPSHLIPGTSQDNVDDRTNRGRGAVTQGEGNGCARLVNGDVLVMRRRRAGGESVTSLAKEFGISVGHASAVLSGKKWSHLEGVQ